MNDLASRLRAEAGSIVPSADAGLAARVLARLPPELPAGRPPLRFPLALAVAAGLAAALVLAWLATSAPPPAAPLTPTAPVAVMPPAPPTLSEMLQQADVGHPVAGELQALQADLASAARTVRGAMPF